MQMLHNLPAGAALPEIETPVLVVDLDALDANISKMAAFAESLGVQLRPHAKAHKSPFIAHKQVAAGAVGICCQKTSEAETMVLNGLRDILITNEIIDPRKMKRIAGLARHAVVRVCLDDWEVAKELDRIAQAAGVEIGVLVEIDVGQGRCGVQGPEEARTLVERVAMLKNLRYDGLQAYHGRAQLVQDYQSRSDMIASVIDIVRNTLVRLENCGIASSIVTGGGTGTFLLEGGSGVFTEIQPGSYVFMDEAYRKIHTEAEERFDAFQQSLFVLSQVISRTSPGRFVLDAGLKAISTDGGPITPARGRDFKVTRVSDEHAILESMNDASLQIGNHFMLVPSHCDTTVALHDWCVGVRDNRVEIAWPILGRGAIA